MRRMMVVAWVVSLVVVLGGWAAVPAAGQDEPSGGVEVDAAVQVTANPNPARGHVMPAVAVHPTDERVLAIAEGDAYGGDCSLHVSTDRGLSWRQTSSPEIPDRWSECMFQNLGVVADVAFSPNGTLYYGFNGFDPQTSEGQVFLARSDDLGDTWETTGLPRVERNVDEGEFGIDALPSIAIDPNDPDRVHVAWMSNYGIWRLRGELVEGLDYYWDLIMRPYVATSTDGGSSFSTPVNLAEDLWLTEDMEGVKTPPRVLAGNDGEVYVIFGEESRAGPREDPGDDALPASVYFTVSRDGGETYEGQSIYTEPPPVDRATAFLWPARAAIDRNNGNLYVVWEQVSNAGQPVSILMIRSTDGGQTWSDPVEVNDERPPRTHTYMEFFPEVSVAPNGRVDVAWYDARNDPTVPADEDDEDDEGNAFHDVYYTYSNDEGQSWAPNVRVTDRLIDRRIGPFDVGDIQGTLGVASTDAGAYIAWDDSRNGTEETQSQDIYFTRVRMEEPESFFSAGPATAENATLLVGAMGAGIALLVGGLLLLIAVRVMSPRRSGTG